MKLMLIVIALALTSGAGAVGLSAWLHASPSVETIRDECRPTWCRD